MDINELQREIIAEVHKRLAGESSVGLRCVSCSDVPSKLEHSLLNPDVSRDKIIAECKAAKMYGVAAVCVAPYHVSAAFEVLQGSGIAVDAAIGFPHGSMSTAAKLAEIRECTNNGATELDVALNVLAIKSGDYDAALKDFIQVVETAGMRAQVKAVFEHGVYSDEEKKIALEIVKQSGAPFIKIQNVLSGVGARVEDVAFVRGILGNNVKIKIDGGVKTLDKAQELLSAGADRIGLTATVSIAQEALRCSRC